MPHSARLEIRLPASLKEEVKRAAMRSGEDVSDFVRVALMAAVRNYPAPTPDDLRKFEQARRDLNGAAHNLNQLARLANQARLGYGTMPDVKALSDAAQELVRLGRITSRIIKLWT